MGVHTADVGIHVGATYIVGSDMGIYGTDIGTHADVGVDGVEGGKQVTEHDGGATNIVGSDMGNWADIGMHGDADAGVNGTGVVKEGGGQDTEEADTGPADGESVT